jgi:hypothetical protein
MESPRAQNNKKSAFFRLRSAVSFSVFENNKENNAEIF